MGPNMDSNDWGQMSDGGAGDWNQLDQSPPSVQDSQLSQGSQQSWAEQQRGGYRGRGNRRNNANGYNNRGRGSYQQNGRGKIIFFYLLIKY